MQSTDAISRMFAKLERRTNNLDSRLGKTFGGSSGGSMSADYKNLMVVCFCVFVLMHPVMIWSASIYYLLAANLTVQSHRSPASSATMKTSFGHLN